MSDTRLDANSKTMLMDLAAKIFLMQIHPEETLNEKDIALLLMHHRELTRLFEMGEEVISREVAKAREESSHPDLGCHLDITIR